MVYENETLSVAIYLYNRWNINESIELFGEWIGKHIYDKWTSLDGDMLRFICELDEDCYNKLIGRACSIYNGRNYRH